MPLLSEEDRKTLTTRFQETLKNDVKIKLFVQSQARSLLVLPGQQAAQTNEYAKVTQDLLEEVVGLSPKLSLEILDPNNAGASEAKRLKIEQVPAIVIGDDDQGRMRFYGAPVGNEFPTILMGIESLSNEAPMLHESVATAVRDRVDEDVHLRVFVTPT